MTHVILLESCRTSGIAYRPIASTSPRHVPIPSARSAEAVMYVPSPRRLYVSFRGTCTLQDVVHVLDVRNKALHTDEMKVHRGFYNKFMSLEKNISDELRKHPMVEEIVFTGHSMGGSLALIASYHYHKKHNNMRIRCHTFGAPQTGNTPFFRYLADNVNEVLCVKLKNDIVPNIPLNPFFTHAENSMHLEDDERFPPWDILYNHSCVTYYQVLNKKVLGQDLYIEQ